MSVKTIVITVVWTWMCSTSVISWSMKPLQFNLFNEHYTSSNCVRVFHDVFKECGSIINGLQCPFKTICEFVWKGERLFFPSSHYSRLRIFDNEDSFSWLYYYYSFLGYLTMMDQPIEMYMGSSSSYIRKAQDNTWKHVIENTIERYPK